MNLYGIFFGTKWAMGRNKRKALQYARANRGTVYVVRYASAYGGGGWDAPTFRATAEFVADYSGSR